MALASRVSAHANSGPIPTDPKMRPNQVMHFITFTIDVIYYAFMFMVIFYICRKLNTDCYSKDRRKLALFGFSLQFLFLKSLYLTHVIKILYLVLWLSFTF